MPLPTWEELQQRNNAWRERRQPVKATLTPKPVITVRDLGERKMRDMCLWMQSLTPDELLMTLLGYGKGGQ